MALIVDAENNYAEKSLKYENWMSFFANRSGERSQLQSTPITIYEFKNHPIFKDITKKYFVFLDEFSGLPELVLIRNYLRCCSIACVVSSTNAEVANLVGLNQRSGSRGGSPKVWSVVLPHMPPITTELIENKIGFKRI